MLFDYQEICEDIVKELPQRFQEVIFRRFGLKKTKKEALETIGQDLGVTRERVRQIQQAGLSKIRPRIKRHQPVLQFFVNQLQSSGNLRRENILLKILSPEKLENQAFFLLSLAEGFKRFLESQEFYTLWTIDEHSLGLAQKTTQKISQKLHKISQPLGIEELKSLIKLEEIRFLAFLEASKEICQGPQGLWGLRDWPEIKPKGTRDRAYIVLKKEKNPLHFRQVARLIEESGIFNSKRKAHPQTVHNELIKDQRFVLVGRGLYALSEWGYKPGTVKKVIFRILKETKKPLSQEEIVEKVSKQRQVAKNTILLNLKDKKYFKQDLSNKYILLRQKF